MIWYLSGRAAARLGPDGAHFLHGEAQHIPLGVYRLQDLVVRGFAEITGALVEEHLEVVTLDVMAWTREAA